MFLNTVFLNTLSPHHPKPPASMSSLLNDFVVITDSV